MGHIHTMEPTLTRARIMGIWKRLWKCVSCMYEEWRHD